MKVKMCFDWKSDPTEKSFWALFPYEVLVNGAMPHRNKKRYWFFRYRLYNSVWKTLIHMYSRHLLKNVTIQCASGALCFTIYCNITFLNFCLIKNIFFLFFVNLVNKNYLKKILEIQIVPQLCRCVANAAMISHFRPLPVKICYN